MVTNRFLMGEQCESGGKSKRGWRNNHRGKLRNRDHRACMQFFFGFIRCGENVIVEDGFEMNVDKGETRRRPWPYGPLGPERPVERPWPTPTPGVPTPRRREQDKTLKQILDKLVEIEKRLERIEKLLTGRPARAR